MCWRDSPEVEVSCYHGDLGINGQGSVSVVRETERERETERQKQRQPKAKN